MEVFERILIGELPCRRVYEDEQVLAFLEIRPRSFGHTLIIPKQKSASFLEMKPEDIANLMLRVQQVARLLQERLSADGVVITTNCGSIVQEVFYTHFHLIPQYHQSLYAVDDFEQVLRLLER